MLPARPRPPSQTSPSAVLQRLERAVRCCREFRLCFIRCDDPVLQDQMCAGLLQRLRGKPVVDVRLETPTPTLLGTLSGEGAPRPAAILVRGLEHSVLSDQASAFLAGWEAELEALRGRYPTLFLVWLPESALERVQALAPGVWAQRSACYEVLPLHAGGGGEAPQAPKPDDPGAAPLTGARAEEASRAEAASAAEDVLQDQPGAQPEAEAAVEAGIQEEEVEAEREEEAAADARELPALHLLTRAQKQAELDRRALRLQEVVETGRASGADTRPLQAALLCEIGILYLGTGEWGRAAAALEESAALFHTLDDRRARGAALLQLGIARHNQGKLDDAEGLYDLSLRIARAEGDRLAEALALHQSGMAQQARGNRERAAALFEESLRAKREIGDRRGEAATLHQLGSLRQRGRDLEGAIRLYRASIEIKRELGDCAGLASTLHQLGTAEHQQGNLGAAMRYYEESLQIKQAAGDRAGIAGTLGQIGRIHQQHGRLREALRYYAGSWLVFRSLGSHYAALARKLVEGIHAHVGEAQFQDWLREDLPADAEQIREALAES